MCGDGALAAADLREVRDETAVYDIDSWMLENGIGVGRGDIVSRENVRGSLS